MHYVATLSCTTSIAITLCKNIHDVLLHDRQVEPSSSRRTASHMVSVVITQIGPLLLDTHSKNLLPRSIEHVLNIIMQRPENKLLSIMLARILPTH